MIQHIGSRHQHRDIKKEEKGELTMQKKRNREKEAKKRERGKKRDRRRDRK